MESYNIYPEDLVQTCVGPVLAASVFVSSYEVCSIDLEGFVLWCLLHSLDLTQFDNIFRDPKGGN